jgi:hypothetical protein
MKQHNTISMTENITNKKTEAKPDEQLLYNLLFTGKITLKEYLRQVKSSN